MTETSPTEDARPAPRFTIDYERLPYGGRPIPIAQPDLLYARARRHRVPVAHPRHARLLELGCAEGGHLIPLAARDPDARFVGVDLSATHIALAEETRDRLGLDNLTLVHADVNDFEPEGPFDYVHVHGVLSWVDAARRSRILSIVGEALAPTGVALLSYNVRAGWGVRDNIRRALMRRVRDLSHPAEVVDHVRALLTFLARQPLDETEYGRLLVAHARAMSKHRDGYLVHEFLSPENQPLAFSEVATAAAQFGLSPIDELTEPCDSTVEAEVREVLEGLSDDPLEQDDLFDLLTGRPFRTTLFAKSDGPRESTSWLEECAFVSRLRPEAPRPSLEAGDTEFFRSPKGARVAVDTPWLKAALLTLASVETAALPESVLLESARALLVQRRVIEDAPMDEGERGALRSDLAHLVGLHHVEARARAFIPPATLSTSPRATTLARVEARTRPWITDAYHRPVRLDRLEATILHLLDGSRDIGAITEAVGTALTARGIPLPDENGEPLQGARRDEFLVGYVRQAIVRFAHLGVVA